MSHTKRIDAEANARFAVHLRAYVDGEHGGNQSAAGRAIGCSPSHISAMLSGERGVGLAFLLTFAAETGKTPNELLGFSGGVEEDRFRKMIREELAAMRLAASEKEKEVPHAKPRSRRPPARRGVLE